MTATFTRRQIIGNIGVLLSGTTLMRVVTALVLILIARQVGIERFGQYAGCMALMRMTSVLFSLGLDVWLLRNGNRDGDQRLLAIHSTTSLVLKAGLGLFWLAGVLLLAPWLDPATFPPMLLIFSALTVWLDELSNTVWNAGKAILQNQAALVLGVGSQLGWLAITLGLIVWQVDAVAPYLIGQMICSALVTLLALIWLVRKLGLILEWGRLSGTLRATTPFAISLALALIYGQADVTIIAHYLGTGAAGLYSPGISLITALALIPTAIYSVMLPVLSQAHRTGRVPFLRLTKQLLLWSTLLSVGIGGAVALIAHPLVKWLYGPPFAATAGVLVILSGVLAVRCINFAVATVLVAVGWQSQRVAIQALAALLNVGFNWWYVAQWGILGVAKIYVFTEWVLLLGYLLLFWWWQQSDPRKTLAVPVGDLEK